MASSFFNSPRGKKNSVATINLTTFVDMFSTMILFLIATVVWDQLASVPVNLGVEDKAASEVPPADVKKITSQVRVSLSKDRAVLVDGGSSRTVTVGTDGEFSADELRAWATQMRAKYVSKRDMLIQVEDNAAYVNLIRVMDQMLAEGFDELVVTGAAGSSAG